VDHQEPEPTVGFTSELGLHVTNDGDTLRGRALAAPEVCVPEAGVIRPSVLLTWGDILMGSLANEHTTPRVCMTVDLSVRVIAPIPAGQECISVGRLLKVGRTLTFAETTFSFHGSDEPAAVALGTFVASPRPEDVSVSVVRGEGSLSRRSVPAVPSPVSAMLQTHVVAPGVVEVPRHPRLLNWADTVQGGAVAACAEEAVLSLGDGIVPTELEVRFLATVRTGPMRATASRFGPWVRVDVVDTGADDRLCGVAAARGD
jgi:acyl-coenzyme A thioesterase PaaI-like protein